MRSVPSMAALDKALAALIAGQNRDPFAALGPHATNDGRAPIVRVFQPAATSVGLVLRPSGERYPMSRRDSAGLYEVQLTGSEVHDYRLRITFRGDHLVELDDPYRYGRVLSDFDLHLLAEGTHHRAYEKLGAHRIAVGSTMGVHFAVWAPNADRVSLI